jgi:hypothetical protein
MITRHASSVNTGYVLLIAHEAIIAQSHMHNLPQCKLAWLVLMSPNASTTLLGDARITACRHRCVAFARSTGSLMPAAIYDDFG